MPPSTTSTCDAEAALLSTASAAEELCDALPTAASQELPAVLELPGKLEANSRAVGQIHATVGFSPAWVVDRFAWPEICLRLLESQARYFFHVGRKLNAATEERHHVVMVAGSRRGEGRTTIALCLARCAAAGGVRVALVDADWDHPQLGARLGLEVPISWIDVADAGSPLEEAAVAALDESVTLFPLREHQPPRRDSAMAGAVTFLREVCAQYPLVVIDGGPLDNDSGLAFSIPAACPIDTAIVVRDLRRATEEDVHSAADQLWAAGVAAVGVAENFQRTR